MPSTNNLILFGIVFMMIIIGLIGGMNKDTGDYNPTIINNFTNGTISLIDALYFNLTPSTPISEGTCLWNDDSGTLNCGLKGGNVSVQIGMEMLLYATNKESTPIVDGQMVYITGAQGYRPTVKLAIANNETTSTKTIAMATETINPNNNGYFTTRGLVHNVNTSAFVAGDKLYLSTDTLGGLTNIHPAAPNHSTTVGFILRSHATEGIILVSIDNGIELDELHDVDTLTLTKFNGQHLIYNSSRMVWENRNLSSVSGDFSVNGNLSATGNVSMKRAYGMFSDNITRGTASTTNSYPIRFNTTEDSYGIHIVNLTNITFDHSGDYLIELSAIFLVTTGQNKHVNIWIRKNGVDIPRSNTIAEFPAANVETVITVPFIVDFHANDYLSVVWAADSTAVQLYSTAAKTNPIIPETPSIILTVSKISEITT
jgi:hypothetical protein